MLEIIAYFVVACLLMIALVFSIQLRIIKEKVDKLEDIQKKKDVQEEIFDDYTKELKRVSMQNKLKQGKL